MLIYQTDSLEWPIYYKIEFVTQYNIFSKISYINTDDILKIYFL